MRRLAIALLLAVAATAGAQTTTCAPELSPNALNTWGVDFVGCTTLPPMNVGDAVTLMLGNTNCPGTVTNFQGPSPLPGTKPSSAVTFSVPDSCAPTSSKLYSANTAQLKVGTTTFDLTLTKPLSRASHTFNLGPATAGDQQGNGQNAAPSGDTQAYRFQYSGEYDFFPPPTTAEVAFRRRFERSFTLSIDTTDQEKGFIDNNSVSGGLYLPSLNVPGLFVQGRIGGQVSYDRAIHSANSDLDAVATLSGLIPALQSINLLGSATRRGSPLSLSFSYGLRRKQVETTGDTPTTSQDNGRVFTGGALYHVFLADNYQIDLSVSTTYNDVDNIPAGTSKTQHAFKAQIWYAQNASSPFKVTTSFENGSFGPVLLKLRQYFVGIALQNLSGKLNTATP